MIMGWDIYVLLIGKRMRMEMLIISGLNLFPLSKLQTSNLFLEKNLVNILKEGT